MQGSVELSGFVGTYQLLLSLPAEVVSKRGGPVKTGLRKGALVLLLEAKLNLAHAVGNLTGDSVTTGLLEQSVVATRGKAPISGKGERYLVRVLRKVYTRNGAKVTTRKSGSLLEYGSEKQPAEPWLRPAFNAKAAEAIQTVERETLAAIDKVVAKLAKQNGAR